MASREKELAGLPQASDPPRGRLSALLGRLVDPFRRGPPPKPHPPTGFYTDTTVCIGCKACEVACKQWNQLPADGFNWTGNSYDNTGELSAMSWRHVKFIEQFSPNSEKPPLTPLTPQPPLPPRGEGEPDGGRGEPADRKVSLAVVSAPPAENRWLMMSDVCKHCVTAPCQQACPTGAIIHNEFENVYIQADICNGCSYCVAACPFGVITRSSFGGHSHKCTHPVTTRHEGRPSSTALAPKSLSDPVDSLRPDRRVARAGQETCRGTPPARRAGRLPVR